MGGRSHLPLSRRPMRLSLILLAAFAPAAGAQPGASGAPLVGTVIGSDTGEPVVGANVAVFQGDQFLTGAATDSNAGCR